MRRALTWLAGAIGLAALLRHLSRRRAAAHATSSPPPPVAEDPADELRRKLADQYEGEETVDQPVDTPADLEARRARVHAQAQEAIDSMRDAGDDPNGGSA